MPLILAIEPDRKQAAQLAGVVRRRVEAELILVDTTERALDAIGNRMPDLVLVPALLSPKDDAALAAALRVIAAAAHVQMLTIPVLASPRPTSRAGGMLSSLRRGKKTSTAEPDGCDPSVFADQIASYLETASQERQGHVAVIEDVRPVAHAAAAREEMAAESASPSFEAIRQDFDEALTQTAAPPIETAAQEPARAAAYEEPVMAAADESVSLALEEAVRALFADPVPSLDVESVPSPAAVIERPRAPSYEPHAASYADTVPFDAGTQSRDPEIPVTEIRFAEPEPAMSADSVESAERIESAPAFDLGVSNLDVAATTLEVDAPLLEAPARSVDAVESVESVESVETVAVSVPSPATAAAEEWAAVDQLMAALQAMPLAALEVTAGDEWIAPPVSDHRKSVERTPEPVKQEPARAASDTTTGVKDKPVTPAPAKSEREWVALIESLRSDVERLRTERAEKPARKETPVAPRVVRSTKAAKPAQDEWGFFDPEQCGFAALLAKLDEVTDDESSPRAVNQ